MKPTFILAAVCVAALGMLPVGVAQSRTIGRPTENHAAEFKPQDGGSRDQNLGTLAFDNCAPGRGCLFSDIQYGGNKISVDHTECHDWCGPVVGGFPFGIRSAINAFTDRRLNLRVGTNGFVKCIPPNSPAPNLQNDGVGLYTWFKVGPSSSGC